MRTIINPLLRIGFIYKIKPSLHHSSWFVNRNLFSTIKSDKNPNQVPEEVKKMIQSQKQKKKAQQLPILKDISQVKSIEQLPEIFKKMVFLNKQNRQITIRYLLSAIYQHKIPFQAILSRTLDVNLSQFPHLKLETQIYQINYMIHQIKQTQNELENSNDAQNKQDKEKNVLELFNKVNDMYFKCFNQTLKIVPAEHLVRSKATLYKHFAEYNFEHLFNPKINDKASSLFDSNLSTLKKARQFLIQSLKFHKQILLIEHKKLQSDEIKALKQEDAQRYEIRLNAIKQNVRKLVESIGECLYAIFKILNKQNRVLKDPFEHRNRKIELLSLIDNYIPFYSILPGIKQLSMMYYKLYKIKIQARYTAVGQPKTQDQLKAKIKETVQDYNRLYRECHDCLEESIKLDKFASIKEISTTIISIKFMIGKTVKKSDVQIKKSLAEEAKSIIDKVKKQFKQPVQYYLMTIIKEMLNLKS